VDARFALEGYIVDELIGFGGTGEVWRAHEALTGETVALKRLRTRGAAATERLRREAGVLATVAGPHVIGVRRLVVAADEAVLVMDHAAGGSLATVLGVRGSLPAPEVVTVLAPIAAALAAAHARDLIHGDITPANILFTADGRPLLADFGVAQALGVGQPSGGSPRQAEGTVDYLDPVVAGGAPPTAASDVFALGAVGFTALTGQSLWGTGSAAEILARAVLGERSSVMALAPTAPPALAEVVESMLSLDPDDRPDARSVAHAVLRACSAAPVGLVHTLAPTPPPMTEAIPRPAEPRAPTPMPSAGSTSVPAGRLRASGRRERPGVATTPPELPSPRRWRRRLVTVAVAVLAIVGAASLGVALSHVGRAQARVLAAPGVTSSPSPSASVVAATPTTSPPTVPATTAASVARPAYPSWLAVVSHLDALRAQAFATGETAPLASVYAPGATAYSADLSTVTSLASRGLRARGFAATVDDVTMESATATTARLKVVDQLSGYDLVDNAGKIVGRGDARPARSFTMLLTNAAGSWRVAAITSS
jgi:serine/threonine protein kinase